MAIIYGTGSYTMQRFTPSDLGLMTRDFDGYEFQIMKRYGHLYWIPLFSLGTIYTISKLGSEDKYEAPPNIKNLMESRHIPFWKHLGAFALPLLAVSIFSLYNIQENRERAASEQVFQAKRSETQQMIADTNALRPSANHFIRLVDCLAKSDLEKSLPRKKIDTSESKIFLLMLNCLTTKRDTTIPYTERNIFLKIPNLEINTSQENSVEEDKFTRYQPYYSRNRLAEQELLRWYYSGFKENPPADAYLSDNLKKINDHLAELKYVATVRYVGYAAPSLDLNMKRFNSGYVQAKVYVYELETNKLVEKYDVLVANSESISYYENKNNRFSSDDNRLIIDLERNIYREVRVSLRIAQSEVDRAVSKMPL